MRILLLPLLLFPPSTFFPFCPSAQFHGGAVDNAHTVSPHMPPSRAQRSYLFTSSLFPNTARYRRGRHRQSRAQVQNAQNLTLATQKKNITKNSANFFFLAYLSACTLPDTRGSWLTRRKTHEFEFAPHSFLFFLFFLLPRSPVQLPPPTPAVILSRAEL